jgi:PAS domain S-box-containing protein
MNISQQIISEITLHSMIFYVITGFILILLIFLLVYNIDMRKKYRIQCDNLLYLDRIFAVSLNGIIAADPRLKIRELNPAAEHIYGYSRGELIGQNFTILLPVSDREDFISALDLFRTDLKSAGLKFPLSADIFTQKKDGSIFPIRIMLGLDSDITVITITDITKEKKRAEELNDALKKAEQANIAKSEFLNNVSHELRTPLHAILSFSAFGLSKMEKSENLPITFPKEKIIEYFENIRVSANRQLFLVNDLLDLSKLEAGKMQFHFRTYDMGALIKLVESSIYPLLEAKKISLITEIAENAKNIYMDSDRIQQVIFNLFSNAIRFSPENGKIIVKSRLISGNSELTEKASGSGFSDAVTQFAEISIHDQGNGIPDDDIKYLFDKFYQSKQTHPGGTGLGLAICRQIVTEHGGSVSARNSDSGGAVFTFTLPIKNRQEDSK